MTTRTPGCDMMQGRDIDFLCALIAERLRGIRRRIIGYLSLMDKMYIIEREMPIIV
jgi:hypothetical protein